MRFLKQGDLVAAKNYTAPAAPRSSKTRNVSDVYAKDAKIFLDKLNIRAERIKPPTMRILSRLSDFRLPSEGEQIRIRTQTQINLISVILKIITEHGTISELTISTYTLNREAFGVLKECLEKGKIEKINLFIASSYSFRDKVYFQYLKTTCLRLAAEYRISLIFAWLHFKITLARCDNNFYQFEGSMNYSMNTMAEQILLCRSREIYEFDYDFLMGITGRTSNKALEIIC